MFPQHLIVEFWFKVQQYLEKEHCVRKEKARKGITEYIELSEKHDFGGCCGHHRREPCPGRV
jgi:hypothetical protein